MLSAYCVSCDLFWITRRVVSKHYGIVLLKRWGAVERSDILRLSYPPVSPMFRDYEAGYRSNTVTPRREAEINEVGMTVSGMHPALRATLRRAFIGGEKVPGKTRDFAIREFCRNYSSPVD